MIWNKSKQPADPQQDAAAAPKKGGAAAFAQKNWKWLVPVAIVVLAGGWWLLKPKGAKPANVDTSYTEAVPETRDVSNTLSGTGTLKPANTYSVKSLVPGKVLTGGFEEGDIVEEGTVLYTVDSSDATTKVEQAAITLQQAQRSYDKTADHQYVRAEVAGVVSSLKVNKGDEVKSGQEVAVVRDSSKMNLVLEFPAADAANFSAGQTAQVTLDGTFEVLPGTITAVTGTDALSTGNLLTRTVTLSVSNAGGLTTAQAATATINGVSSIAAANFQYQAERTLTALASGTVTAINVREGGSVNKDDIILTLSGEELTESIQSASETLRGAELSMQNMQDAMDNYTITSPISGTIIEKNAKVGDALSTGSDLCTIYDLSYLEMTINVDELQVSSLKVGQSVQVTADAVKDKTYEGLVTRVSMKGDTSGGTTTYPVTVRIDETDGLRPGMNANAEIVVAQAKNALTVPNAAIVRGNYVLVRQDSPSAVNADDSMSAPEGYVYVKVKTGVSDDNYTQVTSGLSESDTIAYDPSSVSSDSYYDDGDYDDMGGEVIGGAGNNADLAEGGEETLPEGKELLHDKTRHGVYEGASDKAENFKSGAYTLLTAGVIGLVVVGLLACDLLPVHLTLFSKVATCLVMGTMFIAFIVMGASSYKSYKKHATQAVAESQLKEELVKYCQERLNRELIDQTASVLETESDETAYFKRSAAMKQLISENFLNLDEEYLDHFIDEMYGQIYPNE